MTATAVTPSGLLAELAARGIELQARGDRLRFRPRDALTPELALRIKANKAALLAVLAPADTNTPRSEPVAGGFGSGDSGTTVAAWRARLARWERQAIPAEADRLRCVMATLTSESVEALEERAAIIEFDGKLSRDEAERLAADCLGRSIRRY